MVLCSRLGVLNHPIFLEIKDPSLMKDELASYLNVTLGEGCPRGVQYCRPVPATGYTLVEDVNPILSAVQGP